MSKHTQKGMTGPFGRLRFRGGFSLLELLAVMSIMALLSTLAVTSYVSSVKGMALRSARKHLLNSLTMARQRACVDGARVSLIAYNEVTRYSEDGSTVAEVAPTFVVCKEMGRISFVSGNYLFDEFGDLDKLFNNQSGSWGSSSSGTSKNEGGIRLYNLSAGTWTLVRPIVADKQVGNNNAALLYSGKTKNFYAFAFEKQSGQSVRSSGGSGAWNAGDSYGLEVSPPQALPKGFKFGGTLSNKGLLEVEYVTFEADGTVATPASFTVEASKAAGGKRLQFTVSGDGKIGMKES